MTSGPLVRLPLSSTHRPLEVVRHWRDEGLLLLDTPYQRGDVWGPKRRVNLIRSILLGIPIPSIIVNDRMGADWREDQWQYAVIDGRQRCTTILRFLDNEFAIPGHWVGMEGSVFFRDFGIPNQRRFKQYPIGFCEGRLPTLEQEVEVFELVNFGGVAQGDCDPDAEL